MSKANKVNTEKIVRERKLFEITFLLSLGRGNRLFDLTKEIESFIVEKGGEVLEVEKKETEEFKGGKGKFWSERRKMAYAINKEKACYYTTFWFNLETSFIADLKRFLKLKSEITRFMLISQSEIFALSPSRKAVLASEIISGAPREEKVHLEEKKVEPISTEVPKMEKIEEIKAEPIVTEKVAVEEEPAVKPEIELSSPEISEEVILEPEMEGEKEEEMPVLEAEVEEEKVEEAPVAEKEEIETEKIFDIEKELEIPEIKEETSSAEPETVEDSEEEPTEEVTAPPEEKTEETEEMEDKEAEEFRKEKKKAEDKSDKQRKITLEELDSKLDDILNDDII